MPTPTAHSAYVLDFLISESGQLRLHGPGLKTANGCGVCRPSSAQSTLIYNSSQRGIVATSIVSVCLHKGSCDCFCSFSLLPFPFCFFFFLTSFLSLLAGQLLCPLPRQSRPSDNDTSQRPPSALRGPQGPDKLSLSACLQQRTAIDHANCADKVPSQRIVAQGIAPLAFLRAVHACRRARQTSGSNHCNGGPCLQDMQTTVAHYLRRHCSFSLSEFLPLEVSRSDRHNKPQQ